MEKTYNEYKLNGGYKVMLIPSRTDTQYWHDYIFGKSHIIFIKGRVRFGDGKTPAPFPSAIIIYGEVVGYSTLDIKEVEKLMKS